MDNELLKYLLKKEYDDTYKIDDQKLKCFSKKKFEELQKNSSVKVIGETKLQNNKKEIATVKLCSKTFTISKYKSHNGILYSKAGYIEVRPNEYICLLRFRALIICFIILLILLLGFLGYKQFSNKKPIDNTPGIIEPDFDDIKDDENQVTDDKADETIKVILPDGTVETDHIIKTNDDKKHTGNANVKVTVATEDGKKTLFENVIKISNGKFPAITIDFTKINFELKPGIYDGTITVTLPDGTKTDTKIKIIIVEKTGGTTGIGYSDKVKINLSTGNISMKYKLGKSSHDAVLQLILDKNGKEYLLAESGVIKQDSEITKMTLKSDMKSKLSKGTYKGKLRVYFNNGTNASAGMNTDIEVTITAE